MGGGGLCRCHRCPIFCLQIKKTSYARSLGLLKSLYWLVFRHKRPFLASRCVRACAYFLRSLFFLSVHYYSPQDHYICIADSRVRATQRMLPLEVAGRMVVASAVSPFSRDLCIKSASCIENVEVFFFPRGIRMCESECVREVRYGGHAIYFSNQYQQIYSYVSSSCLSS